MKKRILILVLVISWLIGSNYHTDVYALADWWTRPEVRPTQPSEERNLQTPVSQPTVAPTNSPSQPTVAPTNPPTGGIPSSGGGSSSNDDPCAAGKSYVGPYCGWSPDPNAGKSSGNNSSPRVGGPAVLGLSNTSSSDISLSDIIFLAGILCLTLYARSKVNANNSLS